MKINEVQTTTHRVRPIHSWDPARRVHARLYVLLRTEESNLSGTPMTSIEVVTDKADQLRAVPHWEAPSIMPWAAFERYVARAAN